jgi:hypothetical protein
VTLIESKSKLKNVGHWKGNGMMPQDNNSKLAHAGTEIKRVSNYQFKPAQGLRIKPDYVVQAPTPLGQREVPKPKNGK